MDYRRTRQTFSPEASGLTRLDRSSWFYVSFELPARWQQLVEAFIGMVVDAGKDVGERGFRVGHAENRLVSAYGGTTVNLRYDPLGRLYETSGGFLGLTRFLYDGDELVGEYGPSGSMLRRYVHGRGVDDPMIWYEGSGVEASALRRLRTNHQGSVVAVTNNAGAPVAINAYDDWGLPNGWMTGSAADDNVGRFQYTGQAWIPELGMYYYKARFYSVTLGRFMQTDPIGYKDQMNLYAYVGNDPVNGTDPDGTQTVVGTYDIGCRGEPECVRGALQGKISVGNTALDFTPILGDAKAMIEAFRNPTTMNVSIAGISLIPYFGDVANAGKVIKQLEKGASTLERRALEHEAKLEEFRQNPTVRLGMEGRSGEEIAKQQADRKAHLDREIANFRRQAEEMRRAAEEMRRKP